MITSATLPIPGLNPLRTSFRTLKQMTSRTTGKGVPTVEALVNQMHEALFTYDFEDASITVFPDGFCLYQSSRFEKVFSLDHCQSLVLQTTNGERICISETMFSSGPCLIPLLVIGGDKNVCYTESYESIWEDFNDMSEKFPA